MKFKSVVNFFIFSSILGTAISFSSVYLFHISMLVMFFCLFLVSKGKNFGLKVKPTRFHYFFPFMLIYFLFTILWTISLPNTLMYIFYIFCGSCLALTVIYYGESEEYLNNIFKVCAVAFSLNMIFAILEVYTAFRLPVSPFSQYAELFGRTGKSEIIGMNNSNSVPTGFHWNPNNLATTMSIIFPFFLLHKNLKVKIIGVIAILVIVTATGSRGNLIAILFILLICTLLYNKRFLFIVLPYMLLVFFISPIQGFIFNSSLGMNFKHALLALTSMFSGTSEEGNSIDIRNQLLINGIDALKDSYGIGVGGGASKVIHASLGFEQDAAMHNFWMELLVEGGILFFAIFAIWYFVLTFKLMKISFKNKNQIIGYYASATCVSLIGFIPAAISASSTIYLLPMWLLFGFSVAVINVSKIKEQKFQIV